MTPNQSPDHGDSASRAERNEAILSHMQMGLVVYRLEDPRDDASLTVEEINPAAARILAMDAEGAQGRRMVELFPGMAGHPLLDTYAGVVRSGIAVDLGEVSYGDARLARGDYAVKAFPLPGDRLGLLFEDVTEREAVRRLKEEFVAMVSHELRTPLTSIRGAVGLLAGGVLPQVPPQAQELLDMALRNCDRLSRLVNDLLDLEKVESGRMTFDRVPLEAGHLLESVRSSMVGYAEARQVRLAVTLPSGPLPFRADPDRLHQVLVNLVSNAVKFSPAGEEVVLRAVRGGSQLRLEVEDHGPGIPQAFQPLVFERFTQSSQGAAKGGSGLGLSLAKAFVERMGGQLDFHSEEGRGTCFGVALPLEEPTEVPAHTADILIVEDDPDVARLLQVLLAEGGRAADIARDRREARRMLAEPVTYRALTLDLALPDGSGLELLKELRQDEATRDLPVVVISAWAQEGVQDLEGQALGVVDWLEKPVDLRRLKLAVRKALGDPPSADRPILHVEDDPEQRSLVATALAGLGPLAGAGTLAEAHHWLDGHKPAAVLLDLSLPDGSGLELLPRLGTGQAPPPVIIFSALEPPPELVDRVAANVRKSGQGPEDLRQALQRLLA